MFSEICNLIYFKDSYKLVDKHCEDYLGQIDDINNEIYIDICIV